jgi:hypothetical protein
MKLIKVGAKAAAIVCTIVVAGCLIPVPPRGLWTGSWVSCMCGNHTTLRVGEKDVVLFTYCSEAPSHSVIRDQLGRNEGGAYVWLRYDLAFSRTNPTPRVITNSYVMEPRLLIMSLNDGAERHWLRRDLAFWKARKTMDLCGEPTSVYEFADEFVRRQKERPTQQSSVPVTRGTPPAKTGVAPESPGR